MPLSDNLERKFMEQIAIQLEGMRLKHLAAMKELQDALIDSSKESELTTKRALVRRLIEIHKDMTVLTFMLKRIVNPYGD